MSPGESSYAVTAIGRDRPGIVAAMSGALLELGGNIEDSRMALLGGRFAVMLIVSVPEAVGEGELAERLVAVKETLELDALTVTEAAPATERQQPTHVVSVYGADHPGIVHAVTSALAELGVNVTDLETRLTHGASGDIYVMVMGVELRGADSGKVERALWGVGERSAVEVTISERDDDLL